MCGPQFCAMKLTHEVREIADKDIKEEMDKKSEEFKAKGGEIYV